MALKSPELRLQERFVTGMAGFRAAVTKIAGIIRKFAGKAQRKLKRGQRQMSLKHMFYGAALLVGAQMGPGFYYMTQETDIVRATVEGKVQADSDTPYAGRKYMIYTDQGKFDTFGMRGGSRLKEGCTYDFNLKGARLQTWPPSYSRSISSVSLAVCK